MVTSTGVGTTVTSRLDEVADSNATVTFWVDSTKWSSSVSIEIVPLATPAAIVSEPLGAV